MINIETKQHINFTDKGVTTTFYEGDNVICCIGDNEKYTGKIVAIGNWKETEDSEPYEVICIDTSKSARSYSSEIIKTSDITYMCKNPLADEPIEPISKEESDKKTFCGMLIGLGYDEKQVENLWDNTKKIMKIYNIPVTKMTACTVYALKNNCSVSVPIKIICGIDIEEMKKDIDDLEKTVTKKIAKTILGLGVIGMALKGISDCIDICDNMRDKTE